NDTFSDITGTLSGSDRDSADTVSFELDGSSASSEVGFTVEKSSTYGTFYLNATSGAYKFVANDSAIEALKTTATATFDVNATDGVADSTAQTITITLNGANDTPVLNVVTSGSYTDTAANDTFSDITGTLSGSDRDSADTVSFELDGSSAS
ncbi:VCBS domain-containing protein, partial [Salinivibrio kushneri]|uniref:VCBS domain-containing protein n=1 Tax=Salinivibrio kushneri TaxID=1908198 RepID=UPI0009D44501